MRIQEIKTVGVSGIKVEFNHSELIVLKGLQQRIEEAAKEAEDAEMVMNISSRDAIRKTAEFFNNLIPVDVMSLIEAEESLFSDEHPEPTE